jgi:hypothetical protein
VQKPVHQIRLSCDAIIAFKGFKPKFRNIFYIEINQDGAENKLVVNFQSTPAYAAEQDAINPTAPRKLSDEFHGESHVNMVRTMQASFGWDWGPALPSQGIW